MNFDRRILNVIINPIYHFDIYNSTLGIRYLSPQHFPPDHDLLYLGCALAYGA